ncbi:MAG: homoserine O-succinyltransferase [Clostridia bacterium]|nr:homoserine O-succinyltransferase [Clostridia bacterium]MBO7156472.1 homoserine O-succinyltransferase [Clostridia bacterium]
MPIVIPKEIPAFPVLKKENVFVMPVKRAAAQDIRPIEIALVNLMPTKVETETQIMRLLANTPLQVNLTLIKTATYKSTNVSVDHMERFYKTFDEIKEQKFDGMIITGAPVENMEFNDVLYWEELKDILDYADKNVTSTIYICWGAQAALHHYFGINKIALPQKMFGIFPNRATVQYDPLLKGLNDTFNIPHSRHTRIDEDAVRNEKKLRVLAEGEDCGLSIVKTRDDKKFFFFGHSEYDRETLKNEYLRDKSKGLSIDQPKNYFIDGNIHNIDYSWNSTANLLFYNWLNHYVYQVTPFNLED